MNVNQIINMILRLVMRRAINSGINKGIDMASRRKGQGGQTDADRAQQGQGRETAQRAKQAMRAGRRVGRF